ncbi:MAG: alpha/beta hydrolase-fold protein [Coriobacteriales bacterium]|jgi:predicted alpha/beta superfamily hydrolase
MEFAFHRGHASNNECIWLIDSAERPFDLDEVAHDLSSSVLQIYVNEWNAKLSPWPAQPLSPKGGSFAGGAPSFLKSLIGDASACEQSMGLSPTPSCRAIAGYSLAGLFSLYSFVCTSMFGAAASVSGSLWYDGWNEWLASQLDECENPGGFVYVSLGSRERRASIPRLRAIEGQTRLTLDILSGAGCKTHFEKTPGNHVQNAGLRMRLALAALDRFIDVA